jgi:hypothetical protein
MFASVTVAPLLASAQAPATTPDVIPQSDMVEPLIIEGYRNGRPTISDRAIVGQLNQLLKDQPELVVCLRKTPLGTRIPRGYCGSLRQWYNVEASRDNPSTIARLSGPKGGQATAGGLAGPPPELVQLIRARLQSPKYRAMAEARAKARMEEQAASKGVRTEIPISHP